MLNNPLRYTDPTGHAVSCDAEQDCKETRRVDKLSVQAYVKEALAKYKVRLTGKGWKNATSIAVLAGVVMAGWKFASERGLGETGSAAFTAVLGYVNVGWGGTGAGGDCAKVSSGGCTTNSHQINFWSMSGQLYTETDRMTKNVVHEIGHVLDNSLAYPDPNTGFSRRPDQDIPGGITRDTVLRPNPIAGRLDWQQNPKNTSNEFFADMFIAWTYDAWNTNSDYQLRVGAAQDWMNGLTQP